MSNLFSPARLLRVVLAIALCCLIRRNACQPQLKRFRYVVFACAAVFLLLHISGIRYRLYFALSYPLGIYSRERTPLLLAILWEQLFYGDLLWSLLAGFTILALPRRESPQIQAVPEE